MVLEWQAKSSGCNSAGTPVMHSNDLQMGPFGPPKFGPRTVRVKVTVRNNAGEYTGDTMPLSVVDGEIDEMNG